MFVQYQQQSFWQGTLGVRTRGEPGSVLRSIRETILKADPDMFFWRAQRMNDILAAPLARPRMDALLLVGLGLAALLLAGIGLYAVIGSTVRQRTRELGIRMALGAAPSRLKRQVLGEALVLVGIGGSIGLMVALTGSRLLTAVLFEVSPMDPIALLAAGGLLLATGVFAGYLPAKRATEIDPVRALRAE